MPLFRIAAPFQNLTPIMIPTWNGTMRAGDDLKVAFTLLNDDCETPASVKSSNSSLALFHEPDGRGCWDYGFCHSGPVGMPVMSVAGVVFDGNAGRINFQMPALQTGSLCFGRYRLMISVDQPEGVSTQISGILQVQPAPANVLGNAPRPYMRIGTGAIGQALIPTGVINNAPVDADGFPLTQIVSSGTSAVLGIAILGQAILGSTE